MLVADPILTDDVVEEKRLEIVRCAEEVARQYRKIMQCRQKLLAIPRGMKPKLYRRQVWELARLVVRTSRVLRAIKFQSPMIRVFIDRVARGGGGVEAGGARGGARAAGLETWPGRGPKAQGTAQGAARSTQRLQQLEEELGARRPNCAGPWKSSARLTRKRRPQRRS